MRALRRWTVFLVASFLMMTGPARADVAPPSSTDYSVTVDGINVKIFLYNSGSYTSPCIKVQSGTYSLVREDVATKEVMLLPVVCEKDANDRPYMVDYCVPEGVYRYGLLRPMTCAQYHGTAKVGPMTPCTDPRKLAPKKTSTKPPWDGKATNRTDCAYNEGDETGCAVSGTATSAAQVGAGLLLVLILAWLRRR